MIHTHAEISFRIRRFAAYFLQVYSFVLIACLARGTSWNQVLFNSALWAGPATALFIATRVYALNKGTRQEATQL
jgi:hypothetical protein